MDEKLAKFNDKISKYKSNNALWAKTEKDVKHRINIYRSELDMERTWMHIDMDMFYAACEIRDRPDLVHQPVAVGDYSMI